MIPIAPIIIPTSDRDHDGRRPTTFGILLSVLILSIGLFLAFFLFLTGEFSSPMIVISIVIFLFVISMVAVFATTTETTVRSQRFEREEYRRRQPPIRNYNRNRREKEYCPECGTVVEFSDSYCTTCGVHLDRWK